MRKAPIGAFLLSLLGLLRLSGCDFHHDLPGRPCGLLAVPLLR